MTEQILGTNYTGPYVSDGKFQSSIAFGSSVPLDDLDVLSRLHDSAYAKWEDLGHRTAADLIYKSEADKLIGMFPWLAKELVVYGNHTAQSASNLVTSVASYGLFGVIVGAVENMYILHDQLINGEKYKKEVLAYYKTDPLPHLQSTNRRYQEVDMLPQMKRLPSEEKPRVVSNIMKLDSNQQAVEVQVPGRKFKKRKRRKRLVPRY